jgi:hypothetical protein
MARAAGANASGDVNTAVALPRSDRSATLAARDRGPFAATVSQDARSAGTHHDSFVSGLLWERTRVGW